MKSKKGDESILDTILSRIDPKQKRKVEEKMLLAARIADLVKAKGWSKSEFANKAAVQPNVVTKWLSGDHNFTYDTLVDIAIALEVEVAKFFEEAKPKVAFEMKSSVNQYEYIRMSSIMTASKKKVHNSFGFNNLVNRSRNQAEA